MTITPTGDNNVVDIVKGETHTCTCITDSSRPVTWIQCHCFIIYIPVPVPTVTITPAGHNNVVYIHSDKS